MFNKYTTRLTGPNTSMFEVDRHTYTLSRLKIVI